VLGESSLHRSDVPWTRHVGNVRVIVDPQQRGRGLSRLLLAEICAVAEQGGIERLVQAIGRGRALHLLTTGRTIDAAEAKAIGLFEEVVPRAAFLERVTRLAAELPEVPRPVLAGIKRAADAALPYARPRRRWRRF